MAFKGLKLQRPMLCMLPLKSVPLIVMGAGSDPGQFYLVQACEGNAFKSWWPAKCKSSCDIVVSSC